MYMKENKKGGIPAEGSKENLKDMAERLTGLDFWRSRPFDNQGVGCVRFSDGPHGLRVQVGAADNFGLERSLPATCFPTLAAQASSWDKELLYQTGVRLAEEAAYFGVNVLLGPGVNIKRNPLCGRNFEYLSEEPYLAGELAAQYIRGVQGGGVACCVKHFCANNREFARTVYSSEVSESALRDIYLAPFEAAVEEGGVAAVMTSYNKLNGTYCSENKRLISDILRGEWGFDGIVISDWVGTSDRVAGVKAGEDLEMPRCNLTVDEIVAAVESGDLAKEDIKKCNDRLAEFAQKYSRPAGDGFDGEEHLAFARKAAGECAVLLKNEGALPFAKGEQIAVLGDLAAQPHIQGGGSSRVNVRAADDILSCLSQKFGVTFARGYRRDGRADKKLKKQALKLAAQAKTVVCFMGLTEREDAEGADRENLLLPACQTELLAELYASGIKPVVVLCSGSAVDCGWDKFASALLYLPLTGAGTGGALASILCGEVNPSGKLAETFPLSYSDVPCGETFAKDPYICRYEEDILVGYRWYDAASLSVKYPFGHGLSYTQFAYSDLECNGDIVKFKVKNTGSRAGAEVVQVYICPPDCGIAFPEKKLAAFKKLFLSAGEEREVELVLSGRALRAYDEKRGRFVLFGGSYGVKVGASSRDIRLEGRTYLDGELPEEGSGTALREEIIKRVKSCERAADMPKPTQKKRGERVEISMHSPLIALKDAKGAAGRLIYKIADFYCTGKKQTALLTFRYITVRSAMQYAGFNLAQSHGFIDACNGKFFKGLKKIITKKEGKK